MSPRRLLLALFVFLLVVPAASQAARRNLRYKLTQDTLEAFTFEVKHTVGTTFDRLPPEADSYDTAPLAQSLETVTTTVEGSLERVVGRVFRDSSLGLVTRVLNLKGTVDRGGGAQAASLEGLEGKSVSMRVLESGELLASSGWSHIAGAGRGGELVVPVLLQSVLRLPFQVPEGGGTMPLSFRLRVPFDALLNLDQSWDLAFSAADAPEECGRRCIALTYEGKATEVAEDQHPARPMKRDSQAIVSGTIVLDNKVGRLFSHEFTLRWTHVVTSHRENETVRGALTQEQLVTGSIRAEGAGR